MSYDTVVWLPNALVLTAMLGAFAVWRWRRKGVLVGLRWVGVAMLPLALYGIGLFRLVWSVGLAFSRFVSGFALSPSFWFGLVLLIMAVVLIVLPPRLDKGLDKASGKASGKAIGPTSTQKPAKAKGISSKRSSSVAKDDDMADVEDILRRHGIS